MVTMTDVGEKKPEIETPKEDKKEKYYPTLFLSTKQLPELNGKKPGDKGILQVEYEVRGFTLRSTLGSKEEEGQYDIEIKRIGLSDKPVKEEKDEKETEKLKEEVKGRLKAGRSY